MSRPLAAALMALPGIKAVVPDAVPPRRALNQLAPGAQLPAIVYTVISINPQPYVEDVADTTEAMRLQVNPLARTPREVEQIHDAVRRALISLHGVTLADRLVIDVQLDVAGPGDDTDDDDGNVVRTWPRDYIVVYE